MIMNMLGKLVLAGVLSMVSLPALAHDRHHRGDRHHDRRHHHGQGRGAVHYTPAPVRVYAPAPMRHQVWIPGHWARRGHGHVWIQAAWVLPPRPTVVWVSPQWVWTGGSWQWQEGHWSS
jgi:hypothetical protein